MRREDAPDAICVWDTETGGINIAQDRIFTAYAMVKNIGGEVLREKEWTINPGIPISPEAAEINGLTQERIDRDGIPARQAINEIYMFLSDARRDGYPLVAYNMPFDFGILRHEVKRYFGFDINQTLGQTAKFFDPFVYDVGTVQKRRGNRKLMTVARHYGIAIDESKLHEARYDVEIAAKLAWLMLQKSPHTIEEMQDLQVQWRKAYADNLTNYFESVGKTEEDGSKIIVDPHFPWNKEG